MIRILIFIQAFVLYWGCASVQAPQGGPKDETPPILLSSNPRSGEINFSKKAILLEFSENVVESNSKQGFLSPLTPSVTKPGTKKLWIQPDSGFKPNTTYTLNLSGKIKDSREGVALPDTQLIFSTGAILDTLSQQLNIQDLGNQPSKGKWLVQLKDSTNRLYFAKGEAINILTINGLHCGGYSLLVFNDANENNKYEEEEGQLYFNQINLDSNSILKIKPLPHQSKPIAIFKQRRGDTLSLEANKPIRIGKELESKLIYQSAQKDKFRIFPFKEAIQTEVFDSLGTCSLDTFNFQKIDSSRSIEIYSNVPQIQTNMENKNLKVTYKYPWKISKPPTQIETTYDSVWNKTEFKATGFNLSITLLTPKPGKVKIRMDTIGFFNKKGHRLDSLVITNEDLVPLGEISGTVVTDNQQEIIVELINSKKELVSTSRGKVFLFHVKPGKYSIQSFVDWNGDGFYTGGNIKLNRQAEPLYQSPDIIELKPGWDIEKLQIQPGF